MEWIVGLLGGSVLVAVVLGSWQRINARRRASRMEDEVRNL